MLSQGVARGCLACDALQRVLHAHFSGDAGTSMCSRVQQAFAIAHIFLQSSTGPARTNFSLPAIHEMQQGVARGYLARNAFQQVLRAHFNDNAGTVPPDA